MITTNSKNRVVTLSAITLFALIGYLFADNFLFAREVSTTAIAPTCTLGQMACTFTEANAHLAKDTVAPLVPSSLTVTLNDNIPAPDHLVLALEGVEMNMGIYKLKLADIGARTYRGDVLLPLCMHEEMTWRGQISSPDNQILLPVDIKMVR
ncbi:hypothetical protein [Enterovibrio nigricans]|uniref:YtkA-like domain-containing protein n=1 Tax=Enterovibrio nigricans DSM 22720 TaxID=1121868 RepID=A0A1T4VGC5_9GAMM|nr:hypothetical protein [Enterovibrio nigricans]PKF49246.1 hypothetical protein AT251_20260 [Enterovibrio nigricans]SKA64020.1 hypothetical protein SAMN02745132_03810 [Enterovibrio nigricans DSM 22720]